MTDPTLDTQQTPAAVDDLLSRRLVSLDTFRGFIMMTLAASGFGLLQTANRLGFGVDAEVSDRTGQIWQAIAFNTSHPAWNSQFNHVGVSFWDLIQPAFMFMVGVAMPYSYASRQRRGDSYRWQVVHAIRRGLILVLLGVFLQSATRSETNWLFTNVLSQIGLGYIFVFLLLGRRWKIQLAALAVILFGTWAAFVLYPAPGSDFDYAAVGLDPSQIEPGWFAHFTIHTNVIAAFDRWFLNLFPRSEPFVFHPGGYGTLNFIPSMGTMLMGVMAGQLLRSQRSGWQKVGLLLGSALVCMGIAVLMGASVCPIVKRIWTPAWTLYSGAWVLLMLAVFYLIIDVFGWKFWTFPLVVVGTNSLAIYLMGQLLKPWTTRQLKIHFGSEHFTGPYGPVVQYTSLFLVFWLICLWLYRNRVFFRV